MPLGLRETLWCHVARAAFTVRSASLESIVRVWNPVVLRSIRHCRLSRAPAICPPLRFFADAESRGARFHGGPSEIGTDSRVSGVDTSGHPADIQRTGSDSGEWCGCQHSRAFVVIARDVLCIVPCMAAIAVFTGNRDIGGRHETLGAAGPRARSHQRLEAAVVRPTSLM